MRIKWMKRLDEWVGLPLCLLATLLALPFRLLRRRAARPPRRILLIKFFGLGSLVLATPLIRALRRALPRAEIALLTFQGNQWLLDKIPEIDRVFGIRVTGMMGMVWDVLRRLVHVRAFHPDVVLDLEYLSKFSSLTSVITGARIRAGYWLPRLWRGALLTHPIHYNQHKHITEVFAALAQPLGISLSTEDLRPSRLEAGEMGRAAMEELVQEAHLTPGTPLVGLNPNASPVCLERRWPLDRFAQVAEELVRRTEAHLYVLGSPQERPYVAQMLDQLSPACRSRVSDWSGRTAPDTLLALFERTDLLITNDSGPMHLAAACGTLTVSLFGPETPHHFGPRGAPSHVFWADLYCSPCLNVYSAKSSQCNHARCMQAIGVEEVLQAALDLLDSARAKSKDAPS